MLRYLRQSDAAVGAGFKYPAALRAHHGHGKINDRHQQTAEHARAHRARGHIVHLLHAELTYDLNDDDAERERRKRVHGVVALKQPREKRLGGVIAARLNAGNSGGRRQQRDDDEHGKKRQKHGIQHLPDVDEYLPRPEGEVQHRREKRRREKRQIQLHVTGGEYILQPNRERHRRTARNAEKRADGQVKQAGEEHGIRAADAAGQLIKPAAPADAERGDAHKRQPYARDDEPGDCGQDAAPCKLTHVHGKYKVPRTEKHTEQHTGDIDVLFRREILFHYSPPSCEITPHSVRDIPKAASLCVQLCMLSHGRIICNANSAAKR